MLLSNLRSEFRRLLLTPKGGPLAEPPMLNHDLFVRDRMPSEGILKPMFGCDVPTSTAYRDLKIERGLAMLCLE